MRRREFISLLGGTAAAALPVTARGPDLAWGQTAPGKGKRPVIGLLALNASENDKGLISTFLNALSQLGYVDGETATIVARYAAGEQRVLPMLADEIVRMKPDVVMADTASPIKAVRSAAPGMPIVGAIMGFPVEQGLISSFSHPGGNVTGMASNVEDMNGKLVELGMEIIPGAKQMGLLVDPGGSAAALMRRDFQSAAEKRGIGFHTAEAHVPDEIDGALHQLADAGAAFVCIEPISMLNLNISHIAQTALSLRLPTITNLPQKADTGILLGYGVDYSENYVRAATFVDKILKGVKPGDLPVEFPTKIALAINIKTAKQLGVAVPQALLATADEVIE